MIIWTLGNTTDDQNIARAATVDLTKLTESLLHVSNSLCLKKRNQYFTLHTKTNLCSLYTVGICLSKLQGSYKVAVYF